MNRREWMKQTVMGALVPACVATSASAQGNRFKEPNGKKGWAGGDAGRIEKLGAQWYYTWRRQRMCR